MQQIGKVKMLDKWVPHELTANQKDDCFEASSSLILHNNEPLLHWTVTCDEVGFIQLVTPAQWMDWAAPPKRFSRPNLYQKRSWSLSDGLPPAWSTPAFCIPVKPLPLRGKLSTLMRWHQKLLRLQPTLVNKMGPILHENARLHILQPMFQKLNELGYEALPHLLYSLGLSPTDYHFFKHLNNFLQGKCFCS